jgi:threonine synthase
MKYISTRNKSPTISFSECVTNGIAPDGGLYVPKHFPEFTRPDFDKLSTVKEIAELILSRWITDDGRKFPIKELCESVFNFPVVLRDNFILELFHGPTSSFKDFGAQFLASFLSLIPANNTRTVLVATSGDTGGAVASAFFGRPGFDVVILYPEGRVSARQQQQLTAWGGNVRAFSVRGNFDDCQRIVKEAFMDKNLSKALSLTSANSINIGRLLPQTIYYAAASLWFLRQNNRPCRGFVVPSGNLGNSVAALWAKRMGFPIGKVIIATNANRPVSDYLDSGIWKPMPTIHTLANAMDVGNPSNMERLLSLYPDIAELKTDVSSVSVSDNEIINCISSNAPKYIMCPHTAVAECARRTADGGDWIIVSTAHPAKFDSIVEPLISHTLDVPSSLAEILERTSSVTVIDPTLADLCAHLN